MDLRIYNWLGKDFIALTAEGRADLKADAAMRDLLEGFDGVLKDRGLSLENTVRTRLWGREREDRDTASRERAGILKGPARSAGSSYISESRIDSDARIALELWAMRPSGYSWEKVLQEYEPPSAPLRYLKYDSVVFLSGVTGNGGDLEAHVKHILPAIQGSLEHAGTSWERTLRGSCSLHRSQEVEDLRSLLAAHALVPDVFDQAECFLVDGYAGANNLLEIEVTATV